MSGSLVADLGLGPEVWLFLTLLAIVTLFVKFSRLWSIRNLDLLILFAPAPGMMRLVAGAENTWPAFLWLFLSVGLWLVRCLADLGLNRRPLLEPNLNAAGLTCIAIGMLSLLVAETVSLPVDEGVARNPADPAAKSSAHAEPVLKKVGPAEKSVEKILDRAPLPPILRRKPPQVILSRVLASLGHLVLVGALIAVGARHFERPIAGLCVATSYLLSPYTRIALVDSGQVLPAALIVTAVLYYARPWVAGMLIGLAGGWMPACLGLIPLWFGFYRRRGAWQFALASIGVAMICGMLGWSFPELASWAKALGARSLAEAGLLPNVEAPHIQSFWHNIDPSYRLPVLIAYFALVIAVSIWPSEKNLGELIALSAALLVASQFWYIDAGGTLLSLSLPLVLLMMFRPNIVTKRPVATPPSSTSRRGNLSSSSSSIS
jgi:hypothetical protein